MSSQPLKPADYRGDTAAKMKTYVLLVADCVQRSLDALESGEVSSSGWQYIANQMKRAASYASLNAEDCLLNMAQPSWPTDPREETTTQSVSEMLTELIGHPPANLCEHEWHRYGFYNGEPEIACQKCGIQKPKE